ncbi:hypothetical protein D3C78_632930 [compost metagenome]
MLLNIIGFLTAGLLIGWIDIPPLWKEKKRKELTIFLFLLAASLALSLAKAIKLNVPSPLLFILSGNLKYSWCCSPLAPPS